MNKKPRLTALDYAAARRLAERLVSLSTHWEGCWHFHVACALLRVLDDAPLRVLDDLVPVKLDPSVPRDLRSTAGKATQAKRSDSLHGWGGSRTYKPGPPTTTRWPRYGDDWKHPGVARRKRVVE